MDFWLGVLMGAVLVAAIAWWDRLRFEDRRKELEQTVVGLKRLIGYKDREIRDLLRTAVR